MTKFKPLLGFMFSIILENIDNNTTDRITNVRLRRINDYDTPEIRCSLRNLSRVTEWFS